MISGGFCRIVSVLALGPVVLSAQLNRERIQVPLKPWAAPLYWQPSKQEGEAITLRPEAATAQLPTTSLVFVGITPCRVVDTRAGQGFTGAFGPPSLNANASRTFPLQSSTTCSIPSTALAYSFNLTVVPPGIVGFITVYPTGQPLPLAATLTDVVQGNILSNSAIVPAGSSGSVDVYALNATDLVIDINGYYVPQTPLPTGSPTAPSLTFTGDSTSGFYSAGAGTINVATSGTDRLTIAATGNVGIGTTTPGSKLDVSGDINMTGALRFGGSPVLRTWGSGNIGLGFAALRGQPVGTYNTAIGEGALENDSTGSGNTATGLYALQNNTSGNENTATGDGALSQNTTGSHNTATGAAALFVNTGNANTANGDGALYNNTTGNNNIAVGFQAAANVPATSSNNIHIGSQGSANDYNTIRIGASAAQNAFFAAGIRGVTTGNNDAVPVVIDSNGGGVSVLVEGWW